MSLVQKHHIQKNFEQAAFNPYTSARNFQSEQQYLFMEKMYLFLVEAVLLIKYTNASTAV